MKIKKCGICGKYTLKEICCSKKTLTVKPPKYSPLDKYGKYRRILKKSIRNQ